MGIWVLGLLSGCISNVTGQWAGICNIPTASYEANMDVFVEVFTDNGYDLEGQMTVSDWNGVSRTSSQFFGSRTGQYAELRGRFLSELGYYEMTLDVERQPGSLVGACAFTVPEGEGALLGDVELLR